MENTAEIKNVPKMIKPNTLENPFEQSDIDKIKIIRKMAALNAKLKNYQ